MRPLNFLTFCAVVCCAAQHLPLNAQELEIWRSKSGHSTWAVFKGLDEKTDTVSLLVLKTVPLSALDDESQRRVKAKQAEILQSSKPKPANTREATSKLAKPDPATATPERDVEYDFVSQKYRQLISFKDDPKFHDFGFAIGGPYAQWMKDIQDAHSKKMKNESYAYAVAELIGLGLDYVYKKGAEDDRTRTIRNRIEAVLAGVHWTDATIGKNRTTLTNPEPDQFKYVDDDVYPDVFGFVSLEKLIEFWNRKVDPNPSAQEREKFGIVLIPRKTKVRVISKHPLSKDPTSSIYAFKVEPILPSLRGRELFVIQMDLFDERDPG